MWTFRLWNLLLTGANVVAVEGLLPTDRTICDMHFYGRLTGYGERFAFWPVQVTQILNKSLLGQIQPGMDRISRSEVFGSLCMNQSNGLWISDDAVSCGMGIVFSRDFVVFIKS